MAGRHQVTIFTLNEATQLSLIRESAFKEMRDCRFITTNPKMAIL